MKGREVVIGVTGGIAAFKTAALVSQIVQSGTNVTVVMTEAAEKFIGATTFAGLTGRPVARNLFGDATYPLGAHIELARQADLFCVAPATANFLAKAATGMADDLLSTLYLACKCPILLAPAMNAEMWSKPSVQRNVTQLRQDGVLFVEPESGWLSCRDEGTGRMAAPETILAAIRSLLEKKTIA